jgi:hypothetical protein
VHLFWACPFAKQCWNFICPQRRRDGSIFQAISDMKDKPKLPFAMEIIILAAWDIWIIRTTKFSTIKQQALQIGKMFFFRRSNYSPT